MVISSPRATQTVRENEPVQPEPSGGMPDWIRKTAATVNRMLTGGLNNIGSVTLGTGTSTTVTDKRVSAGSLVDWTPTDEGTAGMIGVWIVSGDGQFTINHPAEPVATRTIKYFILG